MKVYVPVNRLVDGWESLPTTLWAIHAYGAQTGTTARTCLEKY